MDPTSELRLAQVHPDLAAVIRAAKQAPQPFEVIQGVRALAAEQQAVLTGHSTTMHSRHLPDPRYATPTFPAGLACAVDVVALVGGKVDWAEGHEAFTYGQIWAQIHFAATALKIPVEWGGDWKLFKDWGHIQLPWAQYP